MTFSSFAALIGVWVAAIASPGPDLVQIIRLGTKSRAAGVACAVGIMVGNTFWITASLLGLSALIQTVPQVLSVLQIVGGAYLLWMGASAVRAGLAARRQRAAASGRAVATGRGVSAAHEVPTDTTASAATSVSTGKAFGLGVTTNLSNPKAVLFFGAVFAQFVTPGMGWGWIVAITVTLVVIGVVWFVGFALLVDVFAGAIARYGHFVDIVSGVIFTALAVWMIVDGVSGLIGVVSP